jgi:DNA-binding transcriptional LysR family regulator
VWARWETAVWAVFHGVHALFACASFERRRTDLPQGRVSPPLVVEHLDVVEHLHLGQAVALEVLAEFALDGREEALGHRGESVYKWELDKGDESLAIAVNGSLLLDELDLVIQAALDGAGLAWVAEDRVTEHLASGALVRVLEDWCPPFPGFFLYYPSRRQRPAALSALIDTLRLEESELRK